MKNFTILISTLLFFGCRQNEKPKSDILNNETSRHDSTLLKTNDQIVFHPMSDTKTKEVYAQIPLPANWFINDSATGNQAIIEGPNGTKVYLIPYKMYVYTEDPNMRQIYMQGGQPFRYPISIENIIQEDLIPIANRDGSKFIRHYDANEIADGDRNFDALLFKAVPSQQSFHAAVTEWKDAKGNPYIIIVHQNSSLANNIVNWSYYCHAMETTATEYESAKENLIYGLSHTEYNPRYYEEYNRLEAQKANVSWASHNQRMAANQQRFDAQQQAFANRRDAINKASMDGYNSRNESSERSHNRFLNYIKDENTVTDQGSGKRYQVESGGNQYWVNDNGEYIKSNNQNYDPNRDANTNNQTWRETKIED